MKHFGDITKISGYEVPTVDIITGGSPCQDLSVAGKREGLSGERSGLFMEQLRIVKEMREKEKKSGKAINDIRPRYMVWENVPGAFSSNQGRDFQAVLTEIVRIVCPNCPDVPLPKKWAKSGCLMGYGEDGQQFSVAYRVHDAQFWGVPQRRKRIALVADFSGTTAPEILFERCGVQGDTTKGGEEKQDSSPDVTRSIGETISFQERGGKPGGGKGILIQNEHIGAMKTNQNQYVCSIGFNRGNGSGVPTIEEKQPTIQAAAGGDESPKVITTSHGGFMVNADDSNVAQTILATDYKDPQVVCHNETTICLEGNGKRESHKGDGYRESDTMYTLNTVEKHGVCYALDRAMFNQGQNAAYKPSIEKELSQTLVSRGPNAVCARDYKGVGNEYVSEDKCIVEPYQKAVGSLCARDYKGVGNEYVSEDKCIVEPYQKAVGSLCARDYKGAIVRRLTPLECERLQGFPDGFTDIGDWIDSKGKKHKGESDAPRYKALGNSIALPFWQYLAEKMCKYIENPEMASLFDGISGFCLVYARVGCKPIWSSEIEEFPIAVAKKHFGDDEKGEKGDYEKYL